MASVTIVDIAKEAGVSPGTVSRILNKADGFTYAENTRRKVTEVARRLGYAPSIAAQMLRARKSKLVGIAVQPANSYASSLCMDFCSQEVKSLDYVPVTVDVTQEALSPGFNLLGRMDVLCGIICFYSGQEKSLVDIAKQLNVDTPVVTLKSKITDEPMVREVISDYHAGLLEAIDHLCELGHRKVCYVGSGRSPEEAEDMDDRYQFFRQCMDERDMEAVRLQNLREEGVSVFESTARLVPELLARKNITAALCRNDEIALALISNLVKRGVSVPGDFSVIGYDDLPYSAFMNPPLTTIRQDFAGQSRSAVRLLISCIDANEPQKEMLPESIVVKTELVVRDSTAPLRTEK